MLVKSYASHPLQGMLYKCAIGYHYKIMEEVNGKRHEIARGYTYILNKEDAERRMLKTIEAIKNTANTSTINERTRWKN